VAAPSFFDKLRPVLLRPRNILYMILFIVAFYIFILPFWNRISSLFFIGLFIFLGSISYIYRRVFQLRVGFEFIFPGAVLTTLAYGTATGFFVGNVSQFLGELIGFKIDQRIIVGQITINIVVLATPMVWAATGHNWLLAGLILNLIYNGTTAPIFILLGGNPGKTMAFVATSIFWALLFFLRIAPIFGVLMGIPA